MVNSIETSFLYSVCYKWLIVDGRRDGRAIHRDARKSTMTDVDGCKLKRGAT